MKKSRIMSLAGGLVGAAALAAVAIATAPAASAGQSLSGSAFAVKVDVKTGDDQSLVSVPPLPEATYQPGGDKSVVKLAGAAVVDKSHGYVSAKALNAASNAKGDVLASRASAVDLFVRLKGESNNARGILALGAELVVAKCATGPNGMKASSRLVGVKVAGLAGLDKTIVGGSEDKAVEVDPNTTIGLPGLGKIVLNEQITSGKTVTVNAIHVYLKPELKLAHGDIIVSQAVCSTGDDANPSPSSSATSPGASPSASTSPGEPTSPNPGDSTSPSDGGDLPKTGFKLLTFAAVGVALIGVGVVALLLVRRRARATEAT
ncbi:MAG: LPXTG cell wall anchor domain-containing protein [Micromonosporaceae bacterium]|nr:LPXTG cell wall anchor domain-containing protein [Micromonosporaceae bacterium]